MGDEKTTSSSSSAPSNKNVTDTINKLLGGVQSSLAAGPDTFDQSLYVAPGANTNSAWAQATGAASNPDFASGVNGAIGSLSKVAAGDYLDNSDPNFEAALDRAANGTAADVNASIGADGRYGSNVHVNALTDAIGNLRSNAELDNTRYEQQRQTDAAEALPQLFSAAQLPSSVYGAVGAAQDADASAERQGDYDLNQRTGQNAQNNLLAQLSSILGGTASVAGTTTTTTQPSTPWWQTVAGLGLGALSLA